MWCQMTDFERCPASKRLNATHCKDICNYFFEEIRREKGWVQSNVSKIKKEGGSKVM